jgi:hypothetical protein
MNEGKCYSESTKWHVRDADGNIHWIPKEEHKKLKDQDDHSVCSFTNQAHPCPKLLEYYLVSYQSKHWMGANRTTIIEQWPYYRGKNPQKTTAMLQSLFDSLALDDLVSAGIVWNIGYAEAVQIINRWSDEEKKTRCIIRKSSGSRFIKNSSVLAISHWHGDRVGHIRVVELHGLGFVNYWGPIRPMTDQELFASDKASPILDGGALKMLDRNHWVYAKPPVGKVFNKKITPD